jgi:hypothetical protein
MSKKIKLAAGKECLLIRGNSSFLLIGKVGRPLSVCIETMESEYCQGLSEEDIIVVSAPEGGPVEPAVMLLELVRTYGCPLVVLPKGHPGSKRLRYVVSAGDSIRLSCDVQRGTHPEQDILCAAGEYAGATLTAIQGGLKISGTTGDYTTSYLSCEFSAI